MELQVDTYNESQKALQTLIPKEMDFLLRDNALSPSRVESRELHLNCNLVLFLKYFREYKKFIDTQNQPEFFKTNGFVTTLNEFTDKYYPDFLQMINEQSNQNYTKQIINSLLFGLDTSGIPLQGEGEQKLYRRWGEEAGGVESGTCSCLHKKNQTASWI